MISQTFWAGSVIFAAVFSGCIDLAQFPLEQDAPEDAQPSNYPPSESSESQQPKNDTNPNTPIDDPSPAADNPPVACTWRPDTDGSYISWTLKPRANRIYSTEGVLIEYLLPHGAEQHGVATHSLTQDTICTTDDLLLDWPGWSKQEGNPRHDISDPDASRHVHQSIIGWRTHDQPQSEWPSSSGPSYATYPYLAYATIDGVTYYTPIEEQREGSGLIGVYLKTKAGRFYLTEDELAQESWYR